MCVYVSRAVCIVMELELSLKFPLHGTSTRSHIPVTELEFFQVPFSWNLNIVKYNMYIFNKYISERGEEINQTWRRWKRLTNKPEEPYA